jgi:hypothetical protein
MPAASRNVSGRAWRLSTLCGRFHLKQTLPPADNAAHRSEPMHTSSNIRMRIQMKRRILFLSLISIIATACGHSRTNSDSNPRYTNDSDEYAISAKQFLMKTLPNDIYDDIKYHASHRYDQYIAVYFLPIDIDASFGGGFEVYVDRRTKEILQWGPSV